MVILQDYQATSTSPAARFLARGICGGLMGAIPMTLFMLLIHRILPKWQQYALPPEQVTEELFQRIGIANYLNKNELLLATLAAHLGYSSLVGMLYGAISRKLKPRLPVLLKESYTA
jgi:hypothetical protein